MLFGGIAGAGTVEQNDTWEWDGTFWRQLVSQQYTPPRRGLAGLAYDPQLQLMLLFGGGAGVQFNDTWVWNNRFQSWYLLSPITQPPIRSDHAMAYDSVRHRILVFGGYSGGPFQYTIHNDTWEWYDGNWHQRQPTLSPSPRTGGNRLAYDSRRREFVLLGGRFYPPATIYTDTWVYSPPSGMTVDFTATPLSGSPPLSVQFTDLSVTADPGGIRSWAWDFDNDGTTDSTLQNPSYVYTSCGSHSVRLDVSDSWNGRQFLIKRAYISTSAGSVTASFSWQSTASAPNQIQFTDRSWSGVLPPPLGSSVTAWAWDFDGDNVIDSTDQNPVWTLPFDWRPHSVRLTASVPGCGSDSISLDVFTTNVLQNSPNGGSMFSTGTTFYVDADVLQPDGIGICGLDAADFLGSGFATVDIYVTDTTWQGKSGNASAWQPLLQGANGTTPAAPGTTPRLTVIGSTPVHLPQGRYGLAVHFRNSATQLTASVGVTVADTNLSVTPGMMSSSLFSGATNSGRIWFGAFRYLEGWRGLDWIEPGCAGSFGVPVFSSPNLEAYPGAHLRLDMARTAAPTGVLYVGFSRQTWGAVSLPLELTILSSPGCYLLISPDVAFYAGRPPGTGRPPLFLTLDVPNNPSVVGITAYLQWLLLQDPSGIPVVTTRALIAHINAR